MSSTNVSVDGEVVDKLLRPGLLMLAGVGCDDDAAAAKTLAAKIQGLRVLRGELPASDVGTPILVVSQFTLLASTRKDRRPGWSEAASGPVSESIIEALANELEALGATVKRSRFNADMQVVSVSNGPITILVDTAAWE